MKFLDFVLSSARARLSMSPFEVVDKPSKC